MNNLPDDLEVEILGSNNAWFKAWVIDMFKANALCYFEEGWKTERVPFMRIRIPPEHQTTYKYIVNEEVEVKTTTKPSCWWPATVAQISGDRNTFSIMYKNYNYKSSQVFGDLVGRERIRPKASESNFLHPSTFMKFSVEVPGKMTECADVPGVLDEVAFKNFKSITKASLIRYDKETRSVVVLSPHAEVMGIVKRCFPHQLELLEKKVDMLQRQKRLSDRLQTPPDTHRETLPAPTVVSHPSSQTQHTEQFRIEPNFMGLAIGTRGRNINEARKLAGIHAIDLVEDECLFTIVGVSKEAVQSARNMLDYGELSVDVAREIASRLVGRKGSTIQNIIDISSCVRVRLENPHKDSPDEEGPFITRFNFTGTRVSLECVKVLMEVQIHHAKETISLTEQNTISDSKLRDRIYKQPPVSTPVASQRRQHPSAPPMLTPRAPITPPYPENNQDPNVTPQAPDEFAAQAMNHNQPLLQTPTLPPTQPILPKIELLSKACSELTIETQTDPLENFEFAKPAPLPPKTAPKVDKHEAASAKTADPRAPSARVPLQKRPTQASRDNPRVAPREGTPRDTYRTSVRDSAPIRRRPTKDNLQSPRPVSQDRVAATRPAPTVSRPAPTVSRPAQRTTVSPRTSVSPRVATPKTSAAAPKVTVAAPKVTVAKASIAAQKKPKVDVKVAAEKIGAALNGTEKTKSESVRTEQQAAIEDLVKAEKEKTEDLNVITNDNDEDKENSRNEVPINNKNVQMDNQIKMDNQNKGNDNLVNKVDDKPTMQTTVNEAIVCEFSPAV